MPKNTTYVAKQPDSAGFIDYSREEDAVWRDLYAQQLPNVQTHAATAYLDGLARVGMSQTRVPQCPEVSATLRDLTGWQVEAVPALIPFGRFFSMLATKTFPAASFIRRREHFDYIEEPDIFHELFGHAPLLTDPRFAGFSEAIGKAGLLATRENYSWLIRLYWFTIEFGLVVENGGYKALGSGLASSVTELPWSVSEAGPERRPFDIIDILRTPYRIDIHQPIYFVIEDLDDLFSAAERDLLADVRRAQSMGLHAPTYPAKPNAA